MSAAGARNCAGGEFDGCAVTVVGLGLFGGGASVAAFLAARGARVTVTDLRSAEELAPALAELERRGPPRPRLVLGEHREQDFTRAQLVVANPAVPPGSPYLRAARRAGVPITSEMELFLERVPSRVALVSGTNGKSSTCHMLAQLCAAAGLCTHFGGNIGRSLLDDLERLRPQDRCVVEISSYQLAALARPPFAPGAAPRVAACALTNVSADHLERHGTARAYAAAKARLLELASPGGVAIVPLKLCGREPFDELPEGVELVAHSLDERARGARLALEAGRFRLDGEDLGALEDLALPGAFQRANLLVALGAARALGADARSLRASLPQLTALPHRLEQLGRCAGARVVDNGVSTTPESTAVALDAIEGSCTLLCGGLAKRGLALDGLARLARERGTEVVTFGSSAGCLHDAFRAAGVEARACDTLEEGVRVALERARGSTLLFSPACTSFDAYPNFLARALAFRAMLKLPC